MRKKHRLSALLLTIVLLVTTSCGSTPVQETEEKKTVTFGTTAYGIDMGNVGVNPHTGYSGWSAVRYGVGETLFRFTDSMEAEPWLAVGYEQLDDYTIRIDLRDDVVYSSGRKMDGESVKECLKHLIQVHERAAEDLKITDITSKDQSVTIKSSEKMPVLIHYLSDPYGAIIDMNVENDNENIVCGTGPYVVETVNQSEVVLQRNENYWGNEVLLEQVVVKSIQDGETLTMAMQNGEIDAAQGLSYASLSLFQENENFKISDAETSRTVFLQLNMASELLQDDNIRKALALSLNKQEFTDVLLKGNGEAAKGPFSADVTFGDDQITAVEYDKDEAKRLLKESGWEDLNQDGYVEKEGNKLTLKYVTYESRQELPLLAEYYQNELREIGIELLIETTPNYEEVIKSGNFDLFAGTFVSAPTGDPQYFFTTHCMQDSVKNRGQYYNESLEQMKDQLSEEFDLNERAKLGVRMTQTIVDDHAFIFVSHLKMSLVMKPEVEGLAAHPCDFYEVTADLDLTLSQE